jgi:hypothetical protein
MVILRRENETENNYPIVTLLQWALGDTDVTFRIDQKYSEGHFFGRNQCSQIKNETYLPGGSR